MKILAVDTATDICTLALMEGAREKAETTFKVKASHSRHLLGAIRKTLKQVAWGLDDLQGLAVTRGPGSFTGLRIGISAMKGLAVGLGKPLVGVSTLEALAYQCLGTSRLICPMLDGRRGEVFTNHYRDINGIPTPLGNDRSLSPDAALSEINEPCRVIGNGALLYREVIQQAIPQWVRFGSEIQHRIHGATIALIAHAKFAAGETGDPARLTPLYIRKPDAILPATKQQILKGGR